MGDALQLFDARRSKWSQPDGSLTNEAQIFLRGLYVRVGGAIGSSMSELDGWMQFDMREAEAAEAHKQLSALEQQFAFDGQSAAAAELRKAIDALEAMTFTDNGAALAETRKDIEALNIMGAFTV